MVAHPCYRSIEMDVYAPRTADGMQRRPAFFKLSHVPRVPQATAYPSRIYAVASEFCLSFCSAFVSTRHRGQRIGTRFYRSEHVNRRGPETSVLLPLHALALGSALNHTKLFDLSNAPLPVGELGKGQGARSNSPFWHTDTSCCSCALMVPQNEISKKLQRKLTYERFLDVCTNYS